MALPEEEGDDEKGKTRRIHIVLRRIGCMAAGWIGMDGAHPIARLDHSMRRI